ncbi:DUF2635 domain-containing protein [Klebsiella michiganensis]|uniref:DUF2635 domain-containing protein n=1 Tax=Klebsiella michiganensis TaxID=1134687 RepID=UPI0034643E15
MKKHIKPARDGLQVRKADGQRLNPEGENLPASAWWHRREAEGDVVITDIPAESPQTRAVKEK